MAKLDYLQQARTNHSSPKNKKVKKSRIFCPTPSPDAQLDHFLHYTPKLGIPVEMVQFPLKLLLNQRFLAVYHDFH